MIAEPIIAPSLHYKYTQWHYLNFQRCEILLSAPWGTVAGPLLSCLSASPAAHDCWTSPSHVSWKNNIWNQINLLVWKAGLAWVAIQAASYLPSQVGFFYYKKINNKITQVGKSEIYLFFNGYKTNPCGKKLNLS